MSENRPRVAQCKKLPRLAIPYHKRDFKITQIPTPLIPYGRQWLDEAEVAAVADVLRSDYLTQGKIVPQFEAKLCDAIRLPEAVAVANGTLALEAAFAYAKKLGAKTAVMSALTFVGQANAAVRAGLKPFYVDVDENTLNIDIERAFPRLEHPVYCITDFAGAPAEADPALGFCIRDRAHSLGVDRVWVSSCDIETFSFHPVKSITTAEGGAVAARDPAIAQFVEAFRDHGRVGQGQNRRVVELGTNARMSDVHAAIGLVQIEKLKRFVTRRLEIAKRYHEGLKGLPIALPLMDERSAWHLYVIRVRALKRDIVKINLAVKGIATQVHYPVVYSHPTRQFDDHLQCPEAERIAASALSIPIYPKMTNADVDRVIEAIRVSAKECCL